MSLLAHWSMTDVSISHTHALAHLKSKWLCATIAMQKHSLLNTLRASFNVSSQRGVRASRVSKNPLKALRDSQTLGELSNSQKARGPTSRGGAEEEEEEEKKEKIPLCVSIGHQPLWGHCPAPPSASTKTCLSRARVPLTI